ncbi:MAG: stage sporulation protein, partial [Actinomycetota bacterium]|nr:stage sporulation protein [Actinomycetota bacterium]
TTSTTMFPAITTPTAPTTSTTRPAVTTTTTRPGTPPTSRPRQRAVVTSSDPVWAGPVRAGGTVSVPDRQLRYRGELEVTAVAGPLRVINEIDVEQYLWGLGEVSAAWPPAALQAQIVAARTYALRAMAANGEICDTERCQVYKGVTGEFSGQVDAVSKTLGIILGFGGHYASAVFSANAAGISATPQEGFGTSDASHPYLVAAPYVTHSDMTWQVRIALGDLARRLGYPGAATSISVATRGPSGRPIDLQIDGDHGPVRARALDAAAAMGLQSTFWSLHVEAADAAPVAPVAAALIQAAPEDVGRVVAEETQRAVHGATPSNASRRTASAPVHRQQKSHGAVPWLLVLIVVGAGVAGVQVLWRER